MDQYTDVTLIQNYLGRELSVDETAFLTTLIPAIKIWIDKKLNSTFGLVSSSTRYYDGGTNSIEIDPATAITSIAAYDNDGVVNYTYTDLTELITEPTNETVKREIVKRFGYFPKGSRRVAVTAKFSEYDNGVPKDIQTATTIIAVGVLNQGTIASSGGNVASESLEGHSITYDLSTSTLDEIAEGSPIVKSILEIRRELFV